MSKTVSVTSPAEFNRIISSSRIVVVDFYADWCGPCKMIAPVYEQLSQQLSRPGKITFTRVNTDEQQQIAQTYNVRAMPTFIILKQGRETTRIQGADGAKLQDAVKKLAAEAESADSAGPSNAASGGQSLAGGSWAGASFPRGYEDVTSQIETPGLELLNADSELGGARTLFDGSRPSGLASGKSKASQGSEKKDWVESDTDEQLMLFVPFMSTLKIHSLHITSLPPKGESDAAMRPRTIKLFINRPHNLGFEEAEDADATQEVELGDKHWNAETGTANVELRFVKFQKCTSIIVFVVDGDGNGDKVRIDRIRVVGEAGSKREMGKLEKVGEDS